MTFNVLLLTRYAMLAAFALAVLVALGSWLVRTRRLSPFGPVGRALRQLTDPLMRPVERRVVRVGGNPVQAGWWLVIGVAVVGVLVISLVQWALTSWGALASAIRSHTLLSFTVGVVFNVLIAAIFIRVLASWLGRGRYTRWLRPFYWLTDWLVEPIRRILPTAGPFDFSPLVGLLKQFVFQVLR